MVCGASSQLRRSGCVPCICSWPLHWRGCRVHSIPEGNSRCEFFKNKSKLVPRNKRRTEDRRCRLLQKGCENRSRGVKVRQQCQTGRKRLCVVWPCCMPGWSSDTSGQRASKQKASGQGEGLYKRWTKTIGHQKTTVSGKLGSCWLFGLETVMR